MDFKQQSPVYFTVGSDGRRLAGVIDGPASYSLKVRTLEPRTCHLRVQGRGRDQGSSSSTLPAGSRQTMVVSDFSAPTAQLDMDIANFGSMEMVAHSIDIADSAWEWALKTVPVVVEAVELCYPVFGQWAADTPTLEEVDGPAESRRGELYLSVPATAIDPRI